MKKRLYRIVQRVFTGLSLMVMATASFAEKPLVLARDGHTDYKIIISTNASETIKYAASELEYFLKEITGAEFSVLSDATPVGTHEIILGETTRKALKDISGELQPAAFEGYATLKEDKKLFIIGRIPRATLYGVYDFLEEMGVRFLTPRTTHVPDQKRLEYALQSRKYEPLLEERNIFHYMATEIEWKWAVRNKLNCLWATVPMGKRIGGFQYVGGFVHNLPKLFPHEKYFDEHPEYFAMIDGERREKEYPSGKRVSHPCLTNEEVKKIVTATIRKKIDAYKKTNRYNSDNKIMFPIDYHDHSQFCQCPKCQAVNEEEETKGGTIYRFVSEIASELEKDYPNVTFSTLAYSQMIDPPKTVTFGNNVSIRYAPIRADFGRAFDDPISKPNVKALSDMAPWSKKTRNLYIWYYGSNFNLHVIPHPDLRAISRNFKILAENGMKGMFSESSPFSGSGALREVRHYLLAHLMWDTTADGEKLIKEFCQLTYGKGSEGVLEYIDYLHDHHLTKVDPDGENPLTIRGAPPYSHSYDDAFIDTVDAMLEKAENAAETEQEKFNVAVCRLPIWYLRLKSAMSAEGTVTSLPLEWHFKLDENNVGMAEKWPELKDVSSWKKIRTDKFWTDQGYDYHGVAWYATPFDLSRTLSDDGSFALSFGAVDGYCDIFIDGRKIGEQKIAPGKMWNQSFIVPIKNKFDAGKHILTVRVQKESSAAGIWKRVTLQNLSEAVPEKLKIAGTRYMAVSKKTDMKRSAYDDKRVERNRTAKARSVFFDQIRVFLKRKPSASASSRGNVIFKNADMLHSIHKTYSLVEDKTALTGFCQKQTAEKEWTLGQMIKWVILDIKKAEPKLRHKMRVRVKVDKKGDAGIAFKYGSGYYNKGTWSGNSYGKIEIKAQDVENLKWRWYELPTPVPPYDPDVRCQFCYIAAGNNPDNINAIYVDRFELIPIEE